MESGSAEGSKVFKVITSSAMHVSRVHVDHIIYFVWNCNEFVNYVINGNLWILIYEMSMNEFIQMSMWIVKIECEMNMMSMNDIFIVKYYWKIQAGE